MRAAVLGATEVFRPGSYPKFTYNHRSSTMLESSLRAYLETGLGSCLTVYGPSKTGKTVLVERWLPGDHAIWIKGDAIRSVDDLFVHVVDQLKLFTEVTVTESSTDTVDGGIGVEFSVIPQVLRFKASSRGEGSVSEGRAFTRRSLPVSVVTRALQDKPIPIVIDDFHFMKETTRAAVAQAIKDLIRYTHVVLIAIPHQAFEPVEKQRDMDWRVIQLPVAPWEPPELLGIAQDGFPLLGIADHNDLIGSRLSDESRGAPFIMQALCLEYVVRHMGITKTVSPAVDATEPRWEAFLTQIASARKPAVFDALRNGKDTRGVQRVPRVLKDGRMTEIYGAILFTLSQMGAVRRVTKQDVAAKMASLVEDAPTASVISSTLGHLSEIAHENRGADDPALDYKDPELDILDPVLSFYLRHGTWSLPAPPGTR